jgi:hypothetical protein
LAISLFAINAYVWHVLFFNGFTKQTGSIEVLLISFARWLAENWNDRSWMPVWMLGTPVRQVYNPLMHASVGGLIRSTGWSPVEAYHFLTTTMYCLGPVTLFWMTYRGTGRRGLALLTAIIYLLVSPWLFFDENVPIDALGLLNARRLAAMVLTNGITTMGFMLALPAYLFAKLDAKGRGDDPLHWPTLAGIGVLAYAIASFWIPPSLVKTVQESSTGLDIVTPLGEKLAMVAIALTAIMAWHFVFQRARANTWLRFFVYYAITAGTVVVGKAAFGKVFLAMSHRYQLEWEMAFAGVLSYAALAVLGRCPRSIQIAALVCGIAAGVMQVRHYHRFAYNLSTPIDAATREETKISVALAQLFPNQRVFASGELSLWLNRSSNLQQFYGCCDQSVRKASVRGFNYCIYAGGDRARGDEVLAGQWMKVYGISVIGIQDPATSPYPTPFQDQHKFDGVLEEAWHDGASVIYRVPRPNPSLAHVIPISAIPPREPVNGLDLEPLQPLIDALDHPPVLASFRWINSHQAEIAANVEQGQAIYVQETCDPGWEAFESSAPIPVTCDPLGFAVIHPTRAGGLTINYVYGNSSEDNLARGAQFAGLVLLVVWTLRARRAADAK